MFSAETAFSSFAADGKVNQAYMDAGALFVPRVAFALSFFFQPRRHFPVTADGKDIQAYTDAGALFCAARSSRPDAGVFLGQKAWEA